MKWLEDGREYIGTQLPVTYREHQRVLCKHEDTCLLTMSEFLPVSTIG